MAASGVNKCIFVGNLVADAELKGDRTSVLKFRLAVSQSYKDRSGEWKEATEYVPCALWGKRGEGLAPYLVKGTKLFVEGAFKTSKYEKNGESRYSTEITVSNVILLGSSRARAAADDGGEERPARPKPGKPQETGGGSGAYSDADYGPSPDDDIPFVVASHGAAELWWTNPRDRRRPR